VDSANEALNVILENLVAKQFYFMSVPLTGVLENAA
jgi:hypothetical protein